MVDFEVNYTAGKRIRAGETLYRAGGRPLPVQVPALFRLSLRPRIPPASGRRQSRLVPRRPRLHGPGLSVRVRPRPAGRRRRSCCLGRPPLILAKFFLRELQLGQINALITALMLGMIAPSRPGTSRPCRREGAAGVLWGHFHGPEALLGHLPPLLGPEEKMAGPRRRLRRPGPGFPGPGPVFRTFRKPARPPGMDRIALAIDPGPLRYPGQHLPHRLVHEMDRPAGPVRDPLSA